MPFVWADKCPDIESLPDRIRKLFEKLQGSTELEARDAALKFLQFTEGPRWEPKEPLYPDDWFDTIPDDDIADALHALRKALRSYLRKGGGFRANAASKARAFYDAVVLELPPDDGPRERNRFAFGELEVQLTGTEFQILSAVWDAPNRSVKVQDLIDDIWPEKGISEKGLSAHRANVNGKIIESGYSLVTKAGSISLDS